MSSCEAVNKTQPRGLFYSPCTQILVFELSRTGMYVMYPYLEFHKSREPVSS